jgi:uncharacterized protein YdbL (DUF1318 family)
MTRTSNTRTADNSPLRRLGCGILVTLLLACAPAAWAITLQEAKQQGLVGEQRDGFLGSVSAASAAVSELIAQVNRERRARYEQIARENGIALQQVQTLAAKQALEATQNGHYVQDAGGRWVKK